jgi:hypothetical protein
VPLLVQGKLGVPAGMALTHAPGTVLAMRRDAALVVQGTLTAQGTAAAPIIFSSAAAQPAPGDWAGIEIRGSASHATVLDHVQVFYAGGSANNFAGSTQGSVVVGDGTTPTLSNCVIAQSGSVGLYVDDQSRPTVTTCVFLGDAGAAISLAKQDLQRIYDNTFAPGQQGVLVRS